MEILEVSFNCKDGSDRSCDLKSISPNGTYAQDGTLVPQTFSPQFFIPVSGDLLYITVTGKWTLEKYITKIEGLERTIKTIETSRSWRLTAPLRYFSQSLKSIFQKKERSIR